MTQHITSDDLIDRLLEEGFADVEMARRALHSTLAVIGERLVDDEAKALASELSIELAAIVEDVEYDSDFGTEELFERVRRRERTTPAAAREHAEMVLTVLGRSLDHDRRARVARGLPEQAAELLLDRRELGRPPDHPPQAPEHATLASSRPGSTHPLSEAAPRKTDTLATGRPGSMRPIADAGRKPG